MPRSSSPTSAGRHQAEPPLLLRVEEAARLLQLGRTRTFELVWSGELPVIRIGRSVRIPRDQLEGWIRLRTRGGQNP